MDITIFYGTFIVGLILVVYAQFKINSSYNKYKKVKLNANLTGQEIARKILDANGLQNIYVVETKGELSDHYDPRRKVIRLSSHVFKEETVAAASIAAHEVGHAIQDKEGYTFMKIRSFLIPVVNLVSYLGYLGLFISLIAGYIGYVKISIVVILAIILFQLVTLPVEFNASKRAEEELKKLGLINSEEESGVKNVLSAAAFTYVAGLISNLLQLLRLVMILGSRRD